MNLFDTTAARSIYSGYTEDIPMRKTTKIFTLGNSNAFRFTKEIMQALDLKSNDEVSYEITDNHELLIKKVDNKIMHFDDFVKLGKANADFSEDEFGKPLGRELL